MVGVWIAYSDSSSYYYYYYFIIIIIIIIIIFIITYKIYSSPTCECLTSLEALREYLLSEGTCKCGLQCPLVLEETFNFSPDVVSVGPGPPVDGIPGTGAGAGVRTNCCRHRLQVSCRKKYILLPGKQNLREVFQVSLFWLVSWLVGWSVDWLVGCWFCQHTMLQVCGASFFHISSYDSNETWYVSFPWHVVYVDVPTYNPPLPTPLPSETGWCADTQFTSPPPPPSETGVIELYALEHCGRVTAGVYSSFIDKAVMLHNLWILILYFHHIYRKLIFCNK